MMLILEGNDYVLLDSNQLNDVNSSLLSLVVNIVIYLHFSYEKKDCFEDYIFSQIN